MTNRNPLDLKVLKKSITREELNEIIPELEHGVGISLNFFHHINDMHDNDDYFRTGYYLEIVSEFPRRTYSDHKKNTYEELYSIKTNEVLDRDNTVCSRCFGPTHFEYFIKRKFKLMEIICDKLGLLVFCDSGYWDWNIEKEFKKFWIPLKENGWDEECGDFPLNRIEIESDNSLEDILNGKIINIGRAKNSPKEGQIVIDVSMDNKITRYFFEDYSKIEKYIIELEK